MLRGKLSLSGVLAALLITSAWSGMGMAADITPDNVGTMAASANESALGAEKTVTASDELLHIAGSLEDVVQQFQLQKIA